MKSNGTLRSAAFVVALIALAVLQGCAVATEGFAANRAPTGNRSMYSNYNELGQYVRPATTPHNLVSTSHDKSPLRYVYY